MPVKIGDAAPDFNLRSHRGKETVRLSDFRGRKPVVLLFFPFAFTSVCTAEMCSIRDSWSEWEALDAEVLGISVDSPATLAAWAAQERLGFTLLSDFNREAAPRFDALYDDLGGLKGVAKRAAFVVDREGVVRYAEICPSPGDVPDLAQIRKILASLGA